VLNYPSIRLTRAELSALADQAKAGDNDACTRLIQGTIRLYYHISSRMRIPPQYRDDVIQDCILLTYRKVIPLYQPGLCYVAYLGRALRRHMSRSFRRVGGPVTVAHEGARAYAAPLPEMANGVVEPSKCRTAHIQRAMTVLDMLEQESRNKALHRELERLTPRQQMSVLCEGPAVSQAFGITKQAANLTKQATLKHLAKRLHHLR